MPAYIPQKGDFIAVTFNPQSGREQRGRRPALVVSNNLFNKHTGLAIVCPVTNTQRDFPLHVSVGDGLPLTGFIMVEQVKSIDFRARRARKIGCAPQEVLDEVLAMLEAIVF